MDQMGQYQQLAVTYATEYGTKLVSVILFWLVGRWLIGLAGRMLQGALERQKVDPTLMRYIGNFVAVTLNIILVVAILGYCGIQTTTFAALVAGVGIAIGAAWGGVALKPRRRDISRRAPSVQGRRFRDGGRSDRNRQGDRAVRHGNQHPGQHHDDGRQQQDL